MPAPCNGGGSMPIPLPGKINITCAKRAFVAKGNEKIERWEKYGRMHMR